MNLLENSFSGVWQTFHVLRYLEQTSCRTGKHGNNFSLNIFVSLNVH